MKNKELLHEALKLNDNKGVEQLIKQFLLSNELSNTKFNIYNYVAGMTFITYVIISIIKPEFYEKTNK